ncbi:hypothetical protein LSH36_240g03001 [Paralvinella palmiformis]|uniref:Thioredoxin domain-containing protein n=1 Tax=Paralvinella palmiformis TaxID=53620 RepID=A0AAD9JMJ3_9ANNE|nr:hypothetical protein LSH36_240g03001 [Paralvinella palmiformis]
MAQVAEVRSSDLFREFLQNVEGGIAVILFWADWAPQCQQMSDVLVELAKDNQLKHIKFAKVEAEKVPEVSQKYEITAVPTCIIIKNKAVSDRINGANAPELTNKIKQHGQSENNMGGTAGKPDQAAPSPKEELNARLKKLTNAAPVMLFMKGNPQDAKCGFSKTCVQLLQDQKVTFSSFNILADPDIRQGLKEYSNWPTYPQLYVSGKLVGGLDIIKELIESGEFQKMLPKKQTLEEKLKELINSDKVMLFMKGHPDNVKCGFSRTMVGLLNDLGVKFGHFDILQDEEVRQGLKTFSNWPTFPQLYVNGQLVGGVDIVKELIESGEFQKMLPKPPTLEDRLKDLTTSDKVMLFMKGHPDNVKCGFSRTMVEILNETRIRDLIYPSVKYGHFDILQDEEVRQGLKTYSNWPTYPQLYVNGKFVGGVDIIKELKEAGELQSTLKG